MKCYFPTFFSIDMGKCRPNIQIIKVSLWRRNLKRSRVHLRNITHGLRTKHRVKVHTFSRQEDNLSRFFPPLFNLSHFPSYFLNTYLWNVKINFIRIYDLLKWKSSLLREMDEAGFICESKLSEQLNSHSPFMLIASSRIGLTRPWRSSLSLSLSLLFFFRSWTLFYVLPRNWITSE